MMITRSKRKLLSNTELSTENYSVELVKNKSIKKSKSQQSIQKISSQNTSQTSAQNAIRPTVSSQPRLELTKCESFMSRSSQVTAEEAIEMMRKIRKTLDRSFKNVTERLALEQTLSCLYNLQECLRTHNSKFPVEIASENHVYIAQTYLTEARHYQFLHYIRHNLFGFRKFPKIETCIKILQEILKYQPTEMGQLSADYIVSELYSVFTTLTNVFPPCQVREEYFKLFSNDFCIEGFREKKPILTTVIDLIQDLMLSNFEKRKTSQNQPSIDNDFTKTFYLWDMKFNEKLTFSDLPRDDRIDRIFLTLDLLVQILEKEAALFMIKNAHKLGLKVSKTMSRPLLCSAIWESHETMLEANNLIRKIIAIYVMMNELSYPGDKVRIVSRLLSLIGQVINMYEYSGEKVEYPSYKHFTADFAREIQKRTEAASYYSIDLYLKVIENLRSPLLRMLLAHHLFTKISGVSQNISLAVPIDVIYNRQFTHFDDFESKNMRKTEEMYPVYVKAKNATMVKVSRRNYLKLLMVYTEAINSFYRLRDCYVEYRRSDSMSLTQMKTEAMQKKNPLKDEKLEELIDRIDLNERVTLRCVDINYSNLIHVQLTKQSCLFYRNEIKNLLVLCKLISTSRQTLGSSFDEWSSFIAKLQLY